MLLLYSFTADPERCVDDPQSCVLRQRICLADFPQTDIHPSQNFRNGSPESSDGEQRTEHCRVAGLVGVARDIVART